LHAGGEVTRAGSDFGDALFTLLFTIEMFALCLFYTWREEGKHGGLEELLSRHPWKFTHKYTASSPVLATN
jgi:hypothetical protein